MRLYKILKKGDRYMPQVCHTQPRRYAILNFFFGDKWTEYDFILEEPVGFFYTHPYKSISYPTYQEALNRIVTYQKIMLKEDDRHAEYFISESWLNTYVHQMSRPKYKIPTDVRLENTLPYTFFSDTNFELLRQQKQSLLVVIKNSELEEGIIQDMNGILAFIDDFQDTAVIIGIPESKVFEVDED